MTNKEFVLTDESINSKGLIIRTAGIDLAAFKSNPVMLFGHNHEQVLGTWEGIRVEGAKVMATPKFDMDDPDAVKIANKVEKGIIKGASIALDIKEFKIGENAEDPIEILTSVASEASIVPVGANKNALRLSYNSKDFVAENIDELRVELSAASNDDKLPTEAKPEAEEAEKTEEAEVEAPKGEDIPSEEQTEEKVEETVESAQTEATETEETETTEGTSETPDALNVETLTVELSAKTIELSAKVLELTNKEAQILELSNKNKELTEQLKAYKTAELTAKVDKAIEAGKFAVAQRESLIELADNSPALFDKLLSTARANTVIAERVTDSIKDRTDDPRANWTFSDYRYNDNDALEQMRLKDNARYMALYNAEYGKSNM